MTGSMPGIDRDPGLDPCVLAVRALAGATDTDPAGDVPDVDARRSGHRDRGADAVSAVRGLVTGVRVAASLGRRRDAGTAGRRLRGGADERGDGHAPTRTARRGRARTRLWSASRRAAPIPRSCDQVPTGRLASRRAMTGVRHRV